MPHPLISPVTAGLEERLRRPPRLRRGHLAAFVRMEAAYWLESSQYASKC